MGWGGSVDQTADDGRDTSRGVPFSLVFDREVEAVLRYIQRKNAVKEFKLHDTPISQFDMRAIRARVNGQNLMTHTELQSAVWMEDVIHAALLDSKEIEITKQKPTEQTTANTDKKTKNVNDK